MRPCIIQIDTLQWLTHSLDLDAVHHCSLSTWIIQRRSDYTYGYINSSLDNVTILCQILSEWSNDTPQQWAARLAKHAADTAAATANQTAAFRTKRQARKAESYATLCDIHTCTLYILAYCFITQIGCEPMKVASS